MAEEVKAEWVASQKRTFTKWMNNHLRKKGYAPINDAEVDFEDGIMLMKIINALYDIALPKYNKNPKLRPHKLDNLALALAMVEQARIKTNFLKREHLLDHDLKFILGMLWAIILDYAIKGISVDEMTAKEGLLLWCRKKTAGYRDVDPPGVTNFSTSWKNGMALCALIHRHRPDLIDYSTLEKQNDAQNLELAFSVAEKNLDIPRLLEVEDLTGTERPDERSVMTYISEFFHRFASQDIRENAARRVNNFMRFMRHMEEREHQYEARALALIEWTKQQAATLSESKFGDTLEEASSAYSNFRDYVTTVKPAKLGEKLDVETLFAQIQTELIVNNRRPYKPADDVTPDAVEAAFDALSQVERTQGQSIRANRFRFIQKEEHKLSQEKIDEVTAAFHHFDKNGNNLLSPTEFKAALSALGVPFKDEAAFQKVFAEVAEGNANITLDQYIKYNMRLLEDKDTPDQIRDSFLLLADNNADGITAVQLNTQPLTAQDVEYLQSKIPQRDDGKYDYNSYIQTMFAESN